MLLFTGVVCYCKVSYWLSVLPSVNAYVNGLLQGLTICIRQIVRVRLETIIHPGTPSLWKPARTLCCTRRDSRINNVMVFGTVGEDENMYYPSHTGGAVSSVVV